VIASAIFLNCPVAEVLKTIHYGSKEGIGQAYADLHVYMEAIPLKARRCSVIILCAMMAAFDHILCNFAK